MQDASRQIRCNKTALGRLMLRRGGVSKIIVQPMSLVLSQVRQCQLWAPLRTTQQVKASVSGNAGQPSLHRAAAFVTAKLGKRLQKNLLRCFFNQTSLSKELTRKSEYSRTIAPHDLLEGRLVAFTRRPRQVQVRVLFVTVRQAAA